MSRPVLDAVGTSPIRRSVVVPLDPSAAFDLFFRRMSEWWPLATRSLLLTDAASCHVEPKVGGRVYERAHDGRELTWGKVLVWAAPSRVVYTWHPGMAESLATEVEVTFTRVGASTHVDFEHRHWERLGERAADVRGMHERGWSAILVRFVERASGATELSVEAGAGCELGEQTNV